jgi:hypothetical protein
MYESSYSNFNHDYPSRQTPRQSERLAPLLDNVLARLNPVPAYSMLLGVCEDQLPLLLDLTNPAPGAILIVSDVQYGNTLLLKSVLTSACQLNAPSQVQAHVLTVHKGDFANLHGMPQFASQISPRGRDAQLLVGDLCDLLEARQNGAGRGAAHILAIDGLDLILQQFNKRSTSGDAFADFLWLLEEGPQHQIWPVVTVGSKYLDAEMLDIIDHFDTIVIGRLTSMQIIKHLTGSRLLDTSGFLPGIDAVVRSSEGFIKFQIPRLSTPNEGTFDQFSFLEG